MQKLYFTANVNNGTVSIDRIYRQTVSLSDWCKMSSNVLININIFDWGLRRPPQPQFPMQQAEIVMLNMYFIV